ncbi:MAG: alanine racemase [Pseudomonadota bacterium]
MAQATLTIDLDAICANWRALDQMSAASVETAAVVKADAYGLGAARVGPALAQAGARSFFVAQAEEGALLRKALGPGPRILVFSGHMAGDGACIRDADLIPLLNSPAQAKRHADTLPDHSFGWQFNTGMNRLGAEPGERAHMDLGQTPVVTISHLACADIPDDPANAAQRQVFDALSTEGPRSLAATGGTLMGPAYHYNMTRPGVGLYGGLPFAHARPVVRLSIPVIQTRQIAEGEGVGYGLTWRATRPSRIATLDAGYADGLIRAISDRITAYQGDTPCPLVGRISMDLITVDVTDLDEQPDTLDLLNTHQKVDDLATAAGTIGYEILTSLGSRYTRRYIGGEA